MGIWGLSQKGTTLLVKDASRILSQETESGIPDFGQFSGYLSDLGIYCCDSFFGQIILYQKEDIAL